MFVILDRHKTVQDKATEKCNLSRGKGFKNHRVIETDLHVNIGDRIIDGNVIKGKPPVDYEELIQKEIYEMTRIQAISRLKNKGRIPSTFRG